MIDQPYWAKVGRWQSKSNPCLAGGEIKVNGGKLQELLAPAFDEENAREEKSFIEAVQLAHLRCR